MRQTVLLTSFLLAGPVIGAESDALREVMGERVYRQSGIEALSPEQLRVLETWILDHTVDTTAVDEAPAARPEQDEDRGSEAGESVASMPAAEPPRRQPREQREEDTPSVVRSRIDGHFDGWRRNGTLFRLQNGQIWEQRQPGTFVTNLESPEVIIRENRFGHTMEVPAIDRKVHVRRVR